MPSVHNAQLSVDFDLSQGIAITGIHDVVMNRSYLKQSSLFFEFAIDNGPPMESDTGLSAGSPSEREDGSGFTVLTCTADGKFEFQLVATLAADENVAFFELTAINLTQSPIFLRVVLPKIHGVATPGSGSEMYGAVPTEAGYVVPLISPLKRPLGMPFEPATGLPWARNNMELASIFDNSVGGGVFFCDVDGDLDAPDNP